MNFEAAEGGSFKPRFHQADLLEIRFWAGAVVIADLLGNHWSASAIQFLHRTTFHGSLAEMHPKRLHVPAPVSSLWHQHVAITSLIPAFNRAVINDQEEGGGAFALIGAINDEVCNIAAFIALQVVVHAGEFLPFAALPSCNSRHFGVEVTCGLAK